MNKLLACLAALLLCCGAHAQSPDLVLTGTIEGSDHQTYRKLPFDVPPGVHRITVQFEHDGRSDNTVIDLGLLGPDEFGGPHGFRGFSGGNKREFTVSDLDATPSYLPGPITPGRWALLLGLPNTRMNAFTHFTARIYFSRDGSAPALLDKPLNSQAGWYRGDLHLHTAHSDGSCPTQSGKSLAPCPVYFSAAAAAARQLDFVVVSDHNTVSHQQALRELQPHFDQLLLIPGIELTSFRGHANFAGASLPIDFRVGSPEVPSWNALLDRLPRPGFLSINHPELPSGELCMGCGWTARPPIDMARVHGMEVVNGIDAETMFAGLPFWQAELDRGHRLVAIGGSDDHNASRPPSNSDRGRIGMPTTVVHAQALSQAAILAALHEGQVFIDVRGATTGQQRLLEFGARQGDRETPMGGTLISRAGERLTLRIRVAQVPLGELRLLLDGKPLPGDERITSSDHRVERHWTSDGRRHTLRVEVRDEAGRLALIGNPVYLNRP